MLTHQSQSNATTSHGISIQPTNLNPIVPIPSPLNVLQGMDHLFFEEANYYPVADSIDYSIINDSGQRLLCAHVTYCFVTLWNPNKRRNHTHKLIRAIEILDAMKNIVAKTSIMAGKDPEADPKIRRQDGFKIMIGGQPLGILSFKNGCNCHDEFVLETKNGSFDCKFVSKRGCCCSCCCPVCCCGCCQQAFEFYEDGNNELLGQMHRDWPSHPGIFGLSCPDSLDTTKKALLLITGLYLNAVYFEKDSSSNIYSSEIGMS